jgi:ubiquitin-conjugating enzyme E2 Q
MIGITSAVALNEIVNAPEDFVSRAPYLVIAQLNWIQTRYLFVGSRVLERKIADQANTAAKADAAKANAAKAAEADAADRRKYVVQDPIRPAWGPTGMIKIPAQRLNVSRGPETEGPLAKGPADGYETDEYLMEDYDHEDVVGYLREGAPLKPWAPLYLLGKAGAARAERSDVAWLAGEAARANPVAASKAAAIQKSATVPIAAAVSTTGYVPGKLDYLTLQLLPPPTAGHGAASKQLMKRLDEVRATLAGAPNNIELGWHMDVERVDNLFQWIVEMHSFPADLPLTKDMVKAGVTSIVLELRFLDTFPFTPPFVRIVRPRLLPFIQGGGGHVTGGGALCMELLTQDGWLPSLDAANVLLNVRMALCDEEPQPARLASAVLGTAAFVGVHQYGMREAIEGYVRACNAHGWKVPDGFAEALRKGCVD